VQLPASQQTPPAQLAVPMQIVLQELPEQLTEPAHEVVPEHSIPHVFPVQPIVLLQLFAPLHWMSHVPASHVIGPHVSAAKHWSAQVLPLHAIPCAHAPAPAQRTEHELAAVQSIPDVHEFAPVQLTLHGMPGGQTMGAVQLPAVQVTVQAPVVSHVPTPASAQRAGHTAMASTPFASTASPPAPPSFGTVESRVPSAVASLGLGPASENVESGSESSHPLRSAHSAEAARATPMRIGTAAWSFTTCSFTTRHAS
jgi:hypothetical protein